MYCTPVKSFYSQHKTYTLPEYSFPKETKPNTPKNMGDAGAADASNGTSLEFMTVREYNAGFGTKYVPRWPGRNDYKDNRKKTAKWANPYLEITDEKRLVTPVIDVEDALISLWGMQLGMKEEGQDADAPADGSSSGVVAPAARDDSNPIYQLAGYNTEDNQPKIVIRLPLEPDNYNDEEDIAQLVLYARNTYDSYFNNFAENPSMLRLQKFVPEDYFATEQAHPLHPKMKEVKGSTAMKPGVKSLGLRIGINNKGNVRLKLAKKQRLFPNVFGMTYSGIFTNTKKQMINLWNHYGKQGLPIIAQIRWGLSWIVGGTKPYLTMTLHGAIVDDPIPVDFQQTIVNKVVTDASVSRMDKLKKRAAARAAAAAGVDAPEDPEAEPEPGNQSVPDGYDDAYSSSQADVDPSGYDGDEFAASLMNDPTAI